MAGWGKPGFTAWGESAIPAFILWKTLLILWKTWGESGEKVGKPCGKGGEEIGKFEGIMKFCNNFELGILGFVVAIAYRFYRAYVLPKP